MKRSKLQNGRNHNHAQEIAHTAAKILAEEGVNDYLVAKKRAVKRLQLPQNSALPKNIDVHQFLARHLEIFDKKGLLKRQTEFHRLTIQIMEILDDFQPLAVGSVVDGVITASSCLQIHVFAPITEDVTVALINKNIPYELTEQQVRFAKDKITPRPAYNLLMGDTPVNICVFSEKELRAYTLSHIDNRPTKRLGLKSLLAPDNF